MGIEDDGSAAGPLRGVRVVDCTQALAGPYCTMLLADLGADVIKVEPPGGDMTRFNGPFTPEDTERAYGGYFASINRGKRSVVLDLKDERERARFVRLVATADVLVENSRAGVMDRLGVGYESLAAVRPSLVYTAIRGFGDPRTGASPYAHWPAFDIVAQAMGGLVSITGPGASDDRASDGAVLKCGPSVGDIFTGTMAAVGLLAAVIDARASGRGQFVDVAMYDAVLSLCEGAAYQYSYTGRELVPTGNGHPLFAPFDVFPTSDGHCAIAAPSDAVFARLCALIDRHDLALDARFAGRAARLTNRPALNAELRAWTTARTTADVVARLGGEVPVGPVNGMAAVYADEHVRVRRMLVELPQPDGSRPVTLAGQPIHMATRRTGPQARPPRLGEHTDEVLAALDH